MRISLLTFTLASILLPRAATAEFAFKEYKDRLPWIWEAPARSPAPSVKNKAWPADEIDQFILAALEKNNMVPAAPVDDRRWFRRINFAITGLPPRASATQAFLSDKSPERRRKAVQLLLDSPHYGERWARHWMDLVRYAESRGHESDFGIANAWRYRDYLVRAFNSDVPYEQFVVEHLAGAPRDPGQ